MPILQVESISCRIFYQYQTRYRVTNSWILTILWGQDGLWVDLESRTSFYLTRIHRLLSQDHYCSTQRIYHFLHLLYLNLLTQQSRAQFALYIRVTLGIRSTKAHNRKPPYHCIASNGSVKSILSTDIWTPHDIISNLRKIIVISRLIRYCETYTLLQQERDE